MKRYIITLVALAAAILPCQDLWAVKIADITRLDGERANIVQGLGLVIGLNGTGDGGDYLPAIRPLAAMYSKMGSPTDPRELSKAQNVALVWVTAVLPSGGVHEGDRLDVRVSVAGGAASKLTGGTLVSSPLSFAPNVRPLAYAQGQINIENAGTPNTGVIAGGAIINENYSPRVIKEGRMRLILEESASKGNWSTASTIAKIINDSESNGETLAVATDSTTVDVMIPANERERPDSFIARVQQLPVRIVPTEARVTINEATNGIVISGDVEFSPAVISIKGLTITTITPAPVPSARNPVVKETRALALDTTNTGGAKLKDLVDAMDMIKVPDADRVAIIKQLHEAGKIHAKLYVTK